MLFFQGTRGRKARSAKEEGEGRETRGRIEDKEE